MTAECAAAKATLQEQEDQLREKEIECEVLQLNLAKKSERCAELEEVCRSLRATNENAQKVIVDLCGRLEKSKEAYEAAVKHVERLIAIAGKREQMHGEKLAKVEARRVEEARFAEDLWGKIAEAKTAEEELCSKIAELMNERDKKFKNAEKLTASLPEKIWKHEGELTDWAKKLADCESARSSEV